MLTVTPKMVDQSAETLIARLAATPGVDALLAACLDELARLRQDIDPREPSQEQVAMMQGVGVSIAVLWGNASKPVSKHTRGAVRGRLEVFAQDIIALDTLFNSLPANDQQQP